jgi:hypothetical protein
MTVWIYVDTRKQVGDKDHLKAFASEAAAEAWFAEHDPEGVALSTGWKPDLADDWPLRLDTPRHSWRAA